MEHKKNVNLSLFMQLAKVNKKNNINGKKSGVPEYRP